MNVLALAASYELLKGAEDTIFEQQITMFVHYYVLNPDETKEQMLADC